MLILVFTFDVGKFCNEKKGFLICSDLDILECPLLFGC